MKIIYLIAMLLLMSTTAYALEECKGTMEDNEIPCFVLLPNNTSETACNTIIVRYFNTTTNIYNDTMDTYSDYFCNSTFNQSGYGTYVFYYSNGDSGSIIVEENTDNRIYLFIVAILSAITFIAIGYNLEDKYFVTVGGMIFCLVALDLYVNGFPNLVNTFLRNTVSIIFSGIGFLFIIIPWADYYEGMK